MHTKQSTSSKERIYIICPRCRKMSAFNSQSIYVSTSILPIFEIHTEGIYQALVVDHFFCGILTVTHYSFDYLSSCYILTHCCQVFGVKWKLSLMPKERERKSKKKKLVGRSFSSKNASRFKLPSGISNIFQEAAGWK